MSSDEKESRVVVVCSSNNGRGIYRYALMLARFIRGASMLLAPKSGRAVMWEIGGIVRHTKELKSAELVVFCNTRISPLLRWTLSGKKVAVVVHDLMDTLYEERDRRGYLMREIGRFPIRAINTLLMLISYRRANMVIVNSKTTKDELERHRSLRGKKDIIIFTPEGSFTENEIDCNIISNESKGIELIAVTGVAQNKRHQEYFRLVADLVENGIDDFKLTLVGIDATELSPYCLDIYKRHKQHLVLARRISNESLLASYLGADIFLSVSTNEGYGIPLADALGFGLEVVARRIKAYEEVRDSLDISGRVVLFDRYEEFLSLVCQKIGGRRDVVDKAIEVIERKKAYKSYIKGVRLKNMQQVDERLRLG